MTKQAAAFVYASGETPQLWVDGVRNTIQPVGNPSGTLNITDTLELGRGGRGAGPIDYFKGRCSFLGLCARRLPAEVLQTITMAFRDPSRVYGNGTVNRVTDTVMSPVAAVVDTTSAAGVGVTVNVAAASHDPGGLALTCSAAAIVVGSGNITRSGGTVTITPASDAAAGDFIAAEYTVRNSSGKTSSSRVYLTVEENVISGTLKYQTGYATTPANTVRTVGWNLTGQKSNHLGTGAGFREALAVADPGDYIVLADGTYTGDSTITRAGTAANPIHIRSRNHLGATLSGRLLLGSSNTNAAYTWVTGITFTYLRDHDSGLDDSYPVVIRSSNVYVTNNWFPARVAVRYVYNTSMTGCKLNYNTMQTNWPTTYKHAHVVLIHSVGASDPGPSNFEWAYNYVLDTVDVSTSGDSNERHALSLQPQLMNQDSAVGDRTFVMHHNFTRGNFARHFYNKRHCTIEYNIADSYGSGQFGFRHGMPNHAKGTGGIIQGNYINGPILIVNGGGTILRGNYQPRGSMRLFAGTKPVNFPNDPGLYQAAHNTIICDHRGPITVGYGNQSDPLDDGQGGAVHGVDIYRGNQGAPDVSTEFTESPPNANGYQVLNGFGTQPTITTITYADLAGVAGCDDHRATAARP